MVSERDGRDGPTRREYLQYGGSVVVGGALAGCSGESDTGTTETGTGDPETVTTGAATDPSPTTEVTDTNTTTASDEPYTVSVRPIGEVTFDAVPTRWSAPGGPSYVDMGIALGKQDDLVATGFGLFSPVVFEEAGVTIDVDPDDLLVCWQNGGFEKEVFYEADSDVHFADPNYMEFFGMSTDDITEIGENVGPFFGSYGSRNRGWNSDYMYSLYDLFDRVAAVFQEQERGDRFRALYEGLVADIESRLPPEADRPTVGVLFSGTTPAKGEFGLVQLDDDGFRQAPYRIAGFEDAWGSMDIDPGTYPTVGYETLAEYDPDILVVDSQIPTQMASTELEGTADWRATNVAPMEDHEVGETLTAVQNGAVFPGGPAQPGPITMLFNTERIVQQVYPDVFDAEEELFDRARVAAIVDGTF